MDASGLYKFDGLDVWNTYGYAVGSGSDDLLQLYKSKEVYSYDWKGQNGRQYDLSKRYFDDKVATLSGHIVVATKEEFWQKYLALWEFLKSPGAKFLYSHELEQTFSVFYLDSPNVKRFTRLQEFPEMITVQVDIQLQVMFMEMEPPSSTPQPPIVNAGTDKSITLPTNELIITGASVVPKGGATIVSLLWEYMYSVPEGRSATVTQQTTMTPKVSLLTQPGIYHFLFTAVDSNGLQSDDEMTITVNEETVNDSFPYTLPFNLA
ncbi:PKD domain-containing protein [Pedobacter panaciterrae]